MLLSTSIVACIQLRFTSITIIFSIAICGNDICPSQYWIIPLLVPLSIFRWTKKFDKKLVNYFPANWGCQINKLLLLHRKQLDKTLKCELSSSVAMWLCFQILADINSWISLPSTDLSNQLSIVFHLRTFLRHYYNIMCATIGRIK